jgi:hypothetical protein
MLKENKTNSSGYKSKDTKLRLKVATFALIAGLVSSIAISGLLLMVEKVTSIPMGSFYLVLMLAITGSKVYSLNMIASGLLLHLIAGSLIGLFMGIPFILHNKKRSSVGIINKYAPIYGLGFGFALWSLLFIPITLSMILPMLNTLQDRTIIQQVPTGKITSISTQGLLAMQNKIMAGALAFNMFYGLLVAIMICSYNDYLYRKEFHKDAVHNIDT